MMSNNCELCFASKLVDIIQSSNLSNYIPLKNETLIISKLIIFINLLFTNIAYWCIYQQKEKLFIYHSYLNFFLKVKIIITKKMIKPIGSKYSGLKIRAKLKT